MRTWAPPQHFGEYDEFRFEIATSLRSSRWWPFFDDVVEGMESLRYPDCIDTLGDGGFFSMMLLK